MFLLAGSFGIAGAASAPPNPPPAVCMDGKCVSTPGTSSAGDARVIKWHPGVYVNPGNQKCDAAATADNLSTIEQIGDNPNVQGIHIQWKWNCLEGATPGDYSAGFARIDAYLDRLAAHGKRLILGIWPMDYGNCDDNNSSGGVYSHPSAPEYVKAHGGGADGWISYCAPNRLYTAQMWNPQVMDRLIALSRAYAARYDSNPLVEMFSLHDESVGLLGNAADGFTWAAAVTQWRRYTAASVAAWSHTQVMSPINFYDSDATIRAEYSTNYGPGLIFGTCDTLLDSVRKVPGTLVFRGLNSQGAPQAGARDYRAVYKNWFTKIVGGQSLYQSQTPEQTWDYAYNTMHSTYIVWYRIHYNSGWPTLEWDKVWPFISAGNSPVYSTECPPGWTCNTQ
jgi:hypothetical protein